MRIDLQGLWGVLVIGMLSVTTPLLAVEMPHFVQALPIAGSVFDAVIDDADQNGRLDLIVTKRGKEVALILYQKEPRQFAAGPPASVLGVHANRLTVLPAPPHRYLLSAEGEGLLKVLAPDTEAGLKEISRYPHPPAFSATAFWWPGWGLSLAVSPYAGEVLTLVRNFQVETGEAEAIYPIGAENHTVPGETTVVDLNGDGIDELLYTTRRTRTLWRVDAPKDGQQPVAVKLWTAPEGYPRQVFAADLNGDAAQDLLVPLDGARKIAVLLNNGKGEFSAGPVLSLPTQFHGPASLVVGPERDGASLLVARSERSLIFARIEKNMTHSEMLELPIDAPLGQIMLMHDLDGDGSLDMVFNTRATENTVRIIYGPLWQNVKTWTEQQAQPKPEIK